MHHNQDHRANTTHTHLYDYVYISHQSSSDGAISFDNQSEIFFTDDNGKVHPRILSRDHTPCTLDTPLHFAAQSEHGEIFLNYLSVERAIDRNLSQQI